MGLTVSNIHLKIYPHQESLTLFPAHNIKLSLQISNQLKTTDCSNCCVHVPSPSWCYRIRTVDRTACFSWARSTFQLLDPQWPPMSTWNRQLHHPLSLIQQKGLSSRPIAYDWESWDWSRQWTFSSRFMLDCDCSALSAGATVFISNMCFSRTILGLCPRATSVSPYISDFLNYTGHADALLYASQLIILLSLDVFPPLIGHW